MQTQKFAKRSLLPVLGVLTATQAYYYSRTQSITLDEATTLVSAFRAIHGNSSALFRDIHTTFYNMILSLWLSCTGFDLNPQKALSTFFAILSVLALYRVTKRTYGGAVALVGSVLLAFSPLHVYYSQLGRSYGLNILAAIVCTDVFFRLENRGKKSTRFLYLISAWGMVSSHIISILLILIQWLYVLILVYRHKDRARLISWVKLQCLFLIGIFPLLWVILTQYHPFGTLSQYYSWVQAPQPKDLSGILMFWSGTLEFFQPDLISGVLTLALTALSVYGFILSLKGNKPHAKATIFFVMWLFFPALFLFVYSYLFFPVFIYRGMTSSLIPWCIFASLGLCALRPVFKWSGLAFLIGLSLLKTMNNSHTDMENWSGTQLYVQQSMLNHERVFILPDYYSAPFMYYALRPCFFSEQAADCMKQRGIYPIREASEILKDAPAGSEITVISSVLKETEMAHFLEQQKVRSGFRVLTQDTSLKPGVLVWKLYLAGG